MVAVRGDDKMDYVWTNIRLCFLLLILRHYEGTGSEFC